jgi:glutathione peroxidase
MCSAALLFSCQDKTQNIKIDINKTETAMEKQNIYQFKVEDLSGNTFDFSTLKGKKVMIVNTASKCGLTPQYKDLEAIYKEYKDQIS